MGDARGVDKPGWLMRQMRDLERESKHWPERMKQAVREKMEFAPDGTSRAIRAARKDEA